MPDSNIPRSEAPQGRTKAERGDAADTEQAEQPTIIIGEGGEPYVHPAAKEFPLMEGEEFAEFCDRIAAHDLIDPIVVYNGAILDGRNRFRACRAMGVPVRTVAFVGTQGEALDFVINKNIIRRHEHHTQEQRHALIETLLKLNPERSDRAVGKELGFDHKTVGAVRAKAEARGAVPHVERRTDTKGRSQPAAKPRTPSPPAPQSGLAEFEAALKRSGHAISELSRLAGGVPDHMRKRQAAAVRQLLDELFVVADRLETGAAP